ncbi:MAG: cytochrome c maturation protein CcmE [Candidatus Marinimicrobia bacterium]|nr:cytochrome c maturation protein CcmE [Candidatus Neomarinimicrobiota bacterium]
MGKNKFLVVIIGFITVTAFWMYWVSTNPSGTESALIRFLSIDELRAETNHGRVKLGGNVADESIQINQNDLLEATFILSQGEATLPVRYYGTRPDLFKDGAEVIVEGAMEGEVFQAEVLQTKCASRYEGDLRDVQTENIEEM